MCPLDTSTYAIQSLGWNVDLPHTRLVNLRKPKIKCYGTTNTKVQTPSISHYDFHKAHLISGGKTIPLPNFSNFLASSVVTVNWSTLPLMSYHDSSGTLTRLSHQIRPRAGNQQMSQGVQRQSSSVWCPLVSSTYRKGRTNHLFVVQKRPDSWGSRERYVLKENEPFKQRPHHGLICQVRLRSGNPSK